MNSDQIKEVKKLGKKCRAVTIGNNSLCLHFDSEVDKPSVVHGTISGTFATVVSYPLESSQVTYSRCGFDLGKSGKCLGYISTPSYSEEWLTFLKLVKPTDKIRADFILGNNNQLLRDRELFLDQCRLVILRGKQRLVLTVATQVSLNNSARMVQYS